MKYRAIVMAPQVVEFENSGNDRNVSNQAWALCANFDSVVTFETTFGPNLLAVIPTLPEEPLVFDPPPMAA